MSTSIPPAFIQTACSAKGFLPALRTLTFASNFPFGFKVMDTVVVVVMVVMVVMVVLVVSVAIVLVMVLVMLRVEVMMAMVMVVLVVGKKALPSKLCLHLLHCCKGPIKHALPGKVFKSQFPSARMRCSDLDLEQLGCLEGSLRLSDVVCVHM